MCKKPVKVRAKLGDSVLEQEYNKGMQSHPAVRSTSTTRPV